jgi:hypothetical protein
VLWAAVLTLLAGCKGPTTSSLDGGGPADGGTGSSIFKLVRTLAVTPDGTYKTGSFSRINYVTSRDRFLVTFGTKADPGATPCKGAGYAYKEYTVDMQETGATGHLIWNADACEAGDSGSVMVGDTYYLAVMPLDLGHFLYGWQLLKFGYDGASWKDTARIEIALDQPKDQNNDPLVAWVNGELDVSAQYNSSGSPPPLEQGAATHHRFYSSDLAFRRYRLLADTPHVCGSSMIFVDGVYYFLSASAFAGNLIVMKYDQDWKYLGMKELVKTAHWSQGVVFDGTRFYVSYLNTSLHPGTTFLPVCLNVHLAAFDRDFNLVEDVAVTSYACSDFKQPGRPWVILHEQRLYVSYDVDTVDPASPARTENLLWQAYVSIYDLVGR